MIENDRYSTRRTPLNSRTQAEEKILDDKIRQMQKENPNVDYS